MILKNAKAILFKPLPQLDAHAKQRRYIHNNKKTLQVFILQGFM